ncbi:IS66 family transposase [Xenorhabdus griffiniae]|uniref:IS66 family transposase n=1 Tax=Xenorhabdus griffiniae TaxID=351672 RepID=A0ABY9XNF2_9GAMM|nr:IS66 family transposase [Xenorhabdus griffiniae]MBD1226485.1 IS66 family transposase [Xenorhabdus griffiniae]MBE8589372.1 IS66 family transposase [Xenorhabdus griffiniae]WMV74431.1 IS66 family transposase [Xenorhabdus griffiniae]WMV74469.1 IS66 family transposase [Xenorhabdus griffiniae]WMV74484.1 IS66 family transposase [Xenorhabdus griffiniae]
MTDLPDDIDQLKALIGLLQAEIQEKDHHIQHLLEQLNLSKSKRFGKQSEKADKGMFNEAEQQDTLPKPPPAHHKKGRQPLPAGLEREIQRHTLNAPHCDCCGEPLHACGVETSETLKIIPQKVSVIRHERTKYTCRQCEKTETQSKIITAPPPPSLLPRTIASPDTQAAIVTAKYVDALPLYRQADILARSGIEISRSTLANWCVQLGRQVHVLVRLMRTHLLNGSLICADETPVQVLNEADRPAQSQSYMWVYRSGEFATQPVVIFDYQPSRSGRCVADFLGDYAGYLLTDGYAAYDTLKSVKHAGCMAHARRKFTDAQKVQPGKKAGRAEQALTFIAKLYAVEREARLLSPDDRRRLRQEKATPILKNFHDWLTEASQTALPKSAIGTAISYTLNQWPKLLVYLEDGQISIDNNVTERDIRPFTTGRKNWIFSTSAAGAFASANLYSLVMTCRANDLNPYFYFRHIFTELPKRQADDPLHDLLPWNVSISDMR